MPGVNTAYHLKRHMAVWEEEYFFFKEKDLKKKDTNACSWVYNRKKETTFSTGRFENEDSGRPPYTNV